MTREDRTRLFLTAAHLGGLSVIGVVASFGLALPDFVKGLAIGLMVVPLAVMLIRRFRDEYIETLWQSGTSLAFACVVFGFLVLPVLEGFYDGFTGNRSGQDVPAEAIAFATIAAFYIGFHYRWARGLR